MLRLTSTDPVSKSVPSTTYNGRLASGGGYGQALERDPDRVLADVVAEKISIEHAAEAFGVVISGQPPAIDQAATEHRRAELRAAEDSET